MLFLGSNPLVPQTCAECSMDISPGGVHVVAERLGPDKAWHPRCFKCTVCKELLADLIYFASDQQTVYCGRHHGELSVKRCAGCDEVCATPPPHTHKN